MLKLRNHHVTARQNGWNFELPGGETPAYRFAQLDDYSSLARRRFLWKEESTLNLRCRLSGDSLPGTWGFGLWNDPFSMALGLGGMGSRLPALPNCAWFFYASPENHLSFTSGKPASGFLAQTFSAPRIPSLLLAPGLFGAPMLYVKPISRILRKVAGKLIREDAKSLDVDVRLWHSYRLRWGKSGVEFAIDGEKVHETVVSPQGPLGLVIWIDNQFAAWRPDGAIRMGALANPPAWMEIEQFEMR